MELGMPSNLHTHIQLMHKSLVDLAMLSNVGPHRSLWCSFWADVAEDAVASALDTTLGELDDILDAMWGRITRGERPYPEHIALHRLLLNVAGLDKSEHHETLLMLSAGAIKLPRVQDRAGTLALLSSVEQIKDAFSLSDAEGVRQAMTTYIDSLMPGDHSL
jgi:DNA-binding FadR family transcriptional regulator